MADEKERTNHDEMTDKFKEYINSVDETNPEMLDWKRHPELLEDFDEDEDEEDFDSTEGAYDGWQAQRGWSSSSKDSDNKEGNKDSRFLVRKSDDDIKFSTKIVAFNKEGKFLIMADAYSDFWDLPGGHVEDGETPDDGLVREVREEAGLEIDNFEAQLTTELELGEETKPVLFYMGEAVGEPKMSEEHTDFAWVTLEESKKYNLGVFHDVLDEMFEAGYPGGIVAFPIDEELAKSLDLGGYSRNNMHITLAYVRYDEIPHDEWHQIVEKLVKQVGPPPMKGAISSAHVFDESENPERINVLVALIDIPGLKEWQADLVSLIEAEGLVMNETHEFTPHITLDIIENKKDIPEVNIPRQEITFPEAQIWVNNKQHSINFVDTSGNKVE